MPIAIEAVQRIDDLFATGREINGKSPEKRRVSRQARSRPLIQSFKTWRRAECKTLSAKGPLARAIGYQFNHGATFARFLGDGRICLSNAAAEQSIRGNAVGRRNGTFAAPPPDMAGAALLTDPGFILSGLHPGRKCGRAF